VEVWGLMIIPINPNYNSVETRYAWHSLKKEDLRELA
jgi:hypothetical protein